MSHSRSALLCLAGALAAALAGAADPPPESAAEQEPRTSGLLERSEVRLAQLQLSAFGPPEVIGSLTPADIKLDVNFRRVSEFTLDRHCPAAAPEPLTGPEGAAGRTVRNHLFYFDQPHLTLAGRQQAIEVCREMIPELIRDGNRGLIASNSGRLVVVEELTDDPDRLLAALDRLENDRTQWDLYAQQEDSRVARVVELLDQNGEVARAIAAARSYQREEVFLSRKDLRRFAVMLSRLAELPPPTVAVYFADSMRSNAGEHYLTFFGDSLRRASPALDDMEVDAFAGGLAFDNVVNEAAAHGIRLFTVQARGLVTPLDRTPASLGALESTLAVPTSAYTRHRDAQATLADLARETGGRSFLEGGSGRAMAERIREDFACVYVISFDPSPFPRDAPLRVVVKSRRDGIELRSRGRIVMQSPSERLTSRLLGAFALRRPQDEAGLELHTQLVPTGFRRGRYSALLQVSVPGTALTGVEWDIGASLIFRDRVREEVSGRLAVARPGVPLVLEQEVELRPGDNEVVAVAHETATEFVLADHLRVEWPDPDGRCVVCGPVSVLQPSQAAFLREGAHRSSGSLARSEADDVDGSLPTALASLVCRGRKKQSALLVERTLSGGSTVDFPRLELEPGDERCAQVRDMIPAALLAPGAYRYELRVLGQGAELDRAAREFVVR